MANCNINIEHEKLKQQYVTAQYAQRAQQAANMGKTGTPKNTKRKTDWFGFVGAMIVIAVVIIVLRILL